MFSCQFDTNLALTPRTILLNLVPVERTKNWMEINASKTVY